MKSNILHRQTAHDYPLAVRGEGPYLFDQDGKQYLDASGGAAVSCLGHGHADIQQAIIEQVGKLAFAHTGFFSNEPAERLAETLIKKSPAGDGRVMFVSGGSEAIEAAIKLCRQIHVERGDLDRTHYIARRQSYHGTTMGALALGHHVARRKPYEPLLQNGPNLSNVSHVAPCNAYRNQGSLSEEDYSEQAAKDLEDEILRIGPEKVAAFFAETVSGSSLGAMPPTRGYFARIREICDRHGVLLVLDEVMCGMGRTGHLFACEKDEIIPDMIALAKGLGGGYQPIGAVVLKPGLSETIDQGSGALMQSHTYMAHATACACGLAVLNTIERDNLLENVRRQGEQLKDQLNEKFGQHPHIGDIRGRGLFIGLEFVKSRETKEPFARSANISGKVKSKAMEHGLICYPGNGTADGDLGDHILLAPPFIVEQKQLDEIIERLDQTLKDVLS